MELNFESKHMIHSPPVLASDHLDQNARDQIWALRLGLSNMVQYTREFVAAVYLNHVARNPNKKGDVINIWYESSFTLGILSSYNYRKSMDSVMKMRNANHHINGRVDHVALENIKTLFRERFPTTTELRQTVAHGAELTESPSKWEQNSSRKPFVSGSIVVAEGGGQNLVKMFSGPIIALNVSGKDLQLALSVENADFIVQNCNSFISVFREMQDAMDNE